MSPEDLPRMESRYATLRTGPRTVAVIELSHSGKTGDGPYIGHYKIVARFTDQWDAMRSASAHAVQLTAERP